MSKEHALLQLERAVMDTQEMTEAQAADITVRRRAGALVDAVVTELRAHPEYLEDLGLVAERKWPTGPGVPATQQRDLSGNPLTT